MPHA